MAQQQYIKDLPLKIYEIEGAVLLVWMTIKAAPFFISLKSKGVPAQGGQKNEQKTVY